LQLLVADPHCFPVHAVATDSGMQPHAPPVHVSPPSHPPQSTEPAQLSVDGPQRSEQKPLTGMHVHV
jgi:hypothetical protein